MKTDPIEPSPAEAPDLVTGGQTLTRSSRPLILSPGSGGEPQRGSAGAGSAITPSIKTTPAHDKAVNDNDANLIEFSSAANKHSIPSGANPFRTLNPQAEDSAKPPVHAPAPNPSKGSEPVPRLFIDMDSDDPGTPSGIVAAKLVAPRNGGKSPQEATVVKQTVSSEISGRNQPAKTPTDGDNDADSAAMVAKANDPKIVGKSSQGPTVERETLSSENSEGSQQEKPTKKERIESVINLDQPAMIMAQTREELHPNEVAPNPRAESRGDFSKEVASAGRRDSRKGPGNEDDRLLAKTQPSPELLPWLNAAIDPAQSASSAMNLWDVAYSSNGGWLPQTDMQGKESLDQSGILGSNLAKGGDNPGFQETVLSTSPLWGAFFLQSLGRLRPRPHQPTVMVVEGDEATRDQLVVSFANQGYLVLSAPTTHDAMGLLRAPLSPIDVVVLNLSLPDLSGLHLCTYLRKSNPGLQLIVYSDEAEPSELPQLLKLGVNHFLPNPFSLKDLIAGVNSLLQGTTRAAGGN